MLTFLEEQNPILLAFLATLFTYSVTLIGASIVFLFKKVKGYVIILSYWVLVVTQRNYKR